MQKFTPIIVNAPQRSPEWFRARLGSLTASQVGDAISGYYNPTKQNILKAYEFYDLNIAKFDSEWVDKMAEEYPIEFCLRAGIELTESATRRSLRRGIVSERFSGMSKDEYMFKNKAMLWGMQQERFAIQRYRDITGNIVSEAPLFLHPDMLHGASPDGLVIDRETGELGNIESKSLEPWNHLYEIIIPDHMPVKYKPQVQDQMWVNNRDFCDFIGFDPRVAEGIQVFIERIERDNFYIEEVLEPGVRRFLDECDADERQLHATIKSRTEKAKERAKALAV